MIRANPGLRADEVTRRAAPSQTHCAWWGSAVTLAATVSEIPTVIVFIPAPLRQYCENASDLTVSADTVRQVLGEMERMHPQLYRNVCDETGAIRRHLNVFVNADNVRDLDGVATKLSREDVVTILPAVSGG
jgi:sulfur-carrier protein